MRITTSNSCLLYTIMLSLTPIEPMSPVRLPYYQKSTRHGGIILPSTVFLFPDDLLSLFPLCHHICPPSMPRSSSPRPVLSRRQILASLEEELLSLSPSPSSPSLSPSSFSSCSSNSDGVFSRSVLLQWIEGDQQEVQQEVHSSWQEETYKQDVCSEKESELGVSLEPDVESVTWREWQESDLGDQCVPASQGGWSLGQEEDQEAEQEKVEEQVQEQVQEQVVPSTESLAGQVQLEDMVQVATLGVGGFGRVELVTAGGVPYALKKLRKSQIQVTRTWSTPLTYTSRSGHQAAAAHPQ